MLYLSAQPDELYFIWQLELQLHNFSLLKIPEDSIHVLIGYNNKKGLSQEFQRFINKNKQARFFIYPDSRETTIYPSSLRPHIIKQHFNAFNELSKRAIFYHDSDILFRELPDFSKMLKDNIWYLSNTRDYLDSKYIKSKGENIFKNMCDIVGVDPSLIENNDLNAGGAQYLIKNSTYDFWQKVEEDCEKLFFILKIYEELSDKIVDLNPKSDIPIQSWCSDMWALLWNFWRLGNKTTISTELDFCWPHDHISKWRKVKIYHDAGVTLDKSDKLFCKNLFKTSTPYQSDFSGVLKESCSYMYVRNMESFLLSQQ